MWENNTPFCCERPSIKLISSLFLCSESGFRRLLNDCISRLLFLESLKLKIGCSSSNMVSIRSKDAPSRGYGSVEPQMSAILIFFSSTWFWLIYWCEQGLIIRLHRIVSNKLVAFSCKFSFPNLKTRFKIGSQSYLFYKIDNCPKFLARCFGSSMCSINLTLSWEKSPKTLKDIY